MKVAIVGVGKMGYQLAKRLIEDNHEVIAFDRDPALIESVKNIGGKPASSREDVISQFGDSKPVIWLMIPAIAVEGEISAWKDILPEESILVDGGNSDFRKSRDHASSLIAKQIYFVDIGTSGGLLGLKNGFSMMIGGNEKAYNSIEPILVSLSKPKGAYHYFGSSGSGHFIKMVHNAIEYGLMESLAEGYNLLHEGPYQHLDLAAVADVWQHASIVESNLNGLIKEILSQNPSLVGFDGVVAESGETAWALDIAHDMDLEMPAINDSLKVRINSQQGKVSFATQLLAALRNKFGGHNPNPKP